MSQSGTPATRRTPPPGSSLSATNNIEIVVDLNGHVDITEKELNTLTEKQLKLIGHSVKSMNVSKNHFATLEFLKHLPRIVALNASHNRLRRIFSIVHAKATLEEVDLSHNAIGTVEHFLSQMVHLRVLNLSYNQLMSFPLVNELVNLTELNLSSNHLNQLPDLKRLTNLEVLNVALNGITSIKDASLRLPSSIVSLDLSDNHIADLTEVGFLKVLPELKFFGFSGNPGTIGEFNYRPYAASRLISLTTIDGNDLSDEELLLGQRFHLGNTFASFFPGCCRQNELVEILMKESPPCSNPFSVLTPTNPRLLNVKYDFIHNKSDLDSTSSLSEACSTPKRVTRSVPDLRNRANIRVISPPRGNRQSSIIAPVVARGNLKLPDLLSPEPTTCESSEMDDDNESARSTDTVVMTESISLKLDLSAPTVEPLNLPSSTPTPEPRADPFSDFSPDLSVVQEVTEPESGIDNSSTPQRPQRTALPSSDKNKHQGSGDVSKLPTPTKNVLELINEDESILQSMTKHVGWTNIVKESPFPSLISDDQEPAPSAKGTPQTPTATSSKISSQPTPANESTPKALSPPAPETHAVKQVLKATSAAVTDIRQQSTQTPNADVLKRLDGIEKLLKSLSTRVEALESQRRSPVNSPDYGDMMRMFLPMPTKLQLSPEPDDTTIVSWETISPVLPTIRGYAVYVDDKFHTEVKNSVIRFRCPINGRRIGIEAISATNARSLRAEILAGTHVFGKNKENVATTGKRILTPRSARI